MEPTGTLDRPKSSEPVTDPTPSPATSKRVDGVALVSTQKPRRTRWVSLPDGTEVQIAAPRPLEVAWLAQQCMEEVPDLDSKNPGATKRQWNGLKRGFYQVAIALRQVDGKRSFPGTINEPGEWIAGADKVSAMDNDCYEALLEAYNDLTDAAKVRAEMGKGSGMTPNASG